MGETWKKNLASWQEQFTAPPSFRTNFGVLRDFNFWERTLHDKKRIDSWMLGTCFGKQTLLLSADGGHLAKKTISLQSLIKILKKQKTLPKVIFDAQLLA